MCVTAPGFFVEEAKQQVAQRVKLPAGYLHLNGVASLKINKRAAARLMLVVPAALTMIFPALYNFRSVRQAHWFCEYPLCFNWGVVALAITGEYLSVPASVGFIALMGIAVLNGLVMIGYFNQLISRGVAIEEVVREGRCGRLRPRNDDCKYRCFGFNSVILYHWARC